jgi:general secretion pathway protein F
MPVFEYTALNPAGKQVKGSIDSESARAARQKLRSQGLYTTGIREARTTRAVRGIDLGKYLHSDRVSTKNLALATRQLSTLVGAGIPLVESLQGLAEQTDSPVLRRIIIDVRERVQEGSSLAKAIQTFPKAFPRLYVNMVASGEASGTLDAVLENLADSCSPSAYSSLQACSHSSYRRS